MCIFLVCDWLKKSNKLIFDQSQTTLNEAYDIVAKANYLL